MNNFNFTVIEGYLTDDPVLKGDTCHFVLSSTRVYTNDEGKQAESVAFFNVTTVGPVAQTCAKYLKKGARALVSGMLRKNDKIYIEGREVNYLSPAK